MYIYFIPLGERCRGKESRGAGYSSVGGQEGHHPASVRKGRDAS